MLESRCKMMKVLEQAKQWQIQIWKMEVDHPKKDEELLFY